MTKPKVTIGVLLFKDEKYLAYSLPSLLDQDYENIEFIFRDQSPGGEVYNYLKEAHPEFFDKAQISKGENKMHCGGHNAIMRKMKGEYYICVSNDMLYPKDFVSKMIGAMEEKKAKVAGCKLMQWDYKKMLAGDEKGSKTTIIDSLGIGITKAHHFYDIGQGLEEKEVEIPKKLLGPSAALAIYHKDALKAISYKNKRGEMEYFDENLHYKGDVDLAYRLSWAGFPCLIIDSVKVYHDRQVGEKGNSLLKKLKAHRDKANWAMSDSLKGHLITVKKNYDSGFSWYTKIRTFINLGIRFKFTLIFAPRMLKVYADLRKMSKEITKRKKAIQKNVSPKDIESIMS